MCGRYLLEDEVYADIWMYLNKDTGDLSPVPKADGNTIAWWNVPDPLTGVAQTPPHGEVFPTYIAPVITRNGAEAVKWGFPHWKNTGVIINARSETALDKKMFRKPLLEHRCVVPSCGFYEWKRAGNSLKINSGVNSGVTDNGHPGLKTGAKQKFLFRKPGGRLLFMAGIINIYKDAAGQEYSAFVILTTDASLSVAPVHDRMPVILEPDERELWIHDGRFTGDALHRAGPELMLEICK